MHQKAADVISFNDEGKKYDCYLYPIDQLPPRSTGELEEFYMIWNEARGKKKMPSLADMTFERLKGWHSSIRTVQYGEELYDAKVIKIMGEKYADLWGKGTMYERIKSNTPPSDETIKNYYDYLERVYDHHYNIGEGMIKDERGRLKKIRWIDLPLSDDGETVSHAIGALLPA